MSRQNYIFTSESVSEGHPDKVCDRISDAVLDALLAEDAMARVACETFATSGLVVIGGEVGLTDQELLKNYMGRIGQIARDCIREIGYEQEKFHWNTCHVLNFLHEQSAHIAQGVDKDGAGDQGIMFGYACKETPDLMPAPIYYSHRILQLLATARKSGEGEAAKLGPDAKSQVTVRYVDGKASEAVSIVLSTQHLDASWDSKKVREVVEPYIREALGDLKIADDCQWYINPTGKFVIGGPDGDAGLTGRKIIVDTYGGAAPHGGGAFSGKDTTKVDRSAAYAARYLAKNVVAAGLAERCTIQISYAIGVAQPLSIYVDLHGTGKVSEDQVEAAIRKVMDLSPSGIRRHLDLNKPIYAKTSSYGHFGRKAGRDGSFSWEKLDLVKPLKEALSA